MIHIFVVSKNVCQVWSLLMFHYTFKTILLKNYFFNILYIVSPAWQLARRKWVKIFRGKVAVESSRGFLLLSVSFSEKGV